MGVDDFRKSNAALKKTAEEAKDEKKEGDKAAE
jgi:hypothetical protein